MHHVAQLWHIWISFRQAWESGSRCFRTLSWPVDFRRKRICCLTERYIILNAFYLLLESSLISDQFWVIFLVLYLQVCAGFGACMTLFLEIVNICVPACANCIGGFRFGFSSVFEFDSIWRKFNLKLKSKIECKCSPLIYQCSYC